MTHITPFFHLLCLFGTQKKSPTNFIFVTKRMAQPMGSKGREVVRFTYKKGIVEAGFI